MTTFRSWVPCMFHLLSPHRFWKQEKAVFQGFVSKKKVERGGALFIYKQEMVPGKISILYYGLDHHYLKAEIWKFCGHFLHIQYYAPYECGMWIRPSVPECIIKDWSLVVIFYVILWTNVCLWWKESCLKSSIDNSFYFLEYCLWRFIVWRGEILWKSMNVLYR